MRAGGGEGLHPGRGWTVSWKQSGAPAGRISVGFQHGPLANGRIMALSFRYSGDRSGRRRPVTCKHSVVALVATAEEIGMHQSSLMRDLAALGGAAATFYALVRALSWICL
jgi:hypothetical protein